MIKALAHVTGNEEGFITVRCQQKTSCGSCASKGHCGTGIVADAFGSKVLEIKVPSPSPLDVGTLIEIGLEEKTLLRTAFLIYILPLAFVFAGAFLGQYLAPRLMMGEGLVILSSLLSGLVGIGVTRFFSRILERDIRMVPTLLRVFSDPNIDLVLINPATEDSE